MVEMNEMELHVLGTVLLSENNRLHVSEYVVSDPVPVCIKYRYHVQGADGLLIVRWDNAPHHPQIESFPHHCHLPNAVIIQSSVRNLHDVLVQLREYL